MNFNMKLPPPPRTLEVFLCSQDVSRYTEFHNHACGKWVLVTLGEEALGPPSMWGEKQGRVEGFLVNIPPKEFDWKESGLKQLIR
jgi:hypothetical protein